MGASLYYPEFPISELKLENPNGRGSTNTSVRRYTNLIYNNGSDITYSDSATLGMIVTVLTQGVYGIAFGDMSPNGVMQDGIFINSTNAANQAGRMTYSNIQTVNCSSVSSATKYLLPGDIVRILDNTNGNTTTVFGWFIIVKLTW